MNILKQLLDSMEEYCDTNCGSCPFDEVCEIMGCKPYTQRKCHNMPCCFNPAEKYTIIEDYFKWKEKERRKCTCAKCDPSGIDAITKQYYKED